MKNALPLDHPGSDVDQWRGGDSLVNELGADSEGLGHVAQGEGAVGLQQLAVGQDAHLPHVVTVVRSKQPVLLHVLLHSSCARVTQRKTKDSARATGKTLHVLCCVCVCVSVCCSLSLTQL